MTTMREKMARAIQIMDRPKIEYRNADQREADEAITIVGYLALVDAVLSALETPDEAMVEAGNLTWENLPAWDVKEGGRGVRDDVADTFTAMIRAAKGTAP